MPTITRRRRLHGHSPAADAARIARLADRVDTLAKAAREGNPDCPFAWAGVVDAIKELTVSREAEIAERVKQGVNEATRPESQRAAHEAAKDAEVRQLRETHARVLEREKIDAYQRGWIDALAKRDKAA